MATPNKKKTTATPASKQTPKTGTMTGRGPAKTTGKPASKSR